MPSDTTTPIDSQIVRSRISCKMTFPVGYEFLREHFQDFPHWAEARFYFRSHPTFRASGFTALLRAQKPYPILRLEHRFEDWVPPRPPTHWHFTIYPVLRELKSIAYRGLVGGPLATLQHFVAHVPTYDGYHNQVEVLFDPADGTCKAEIAWPLERTGA